MTPVELALAEADLVDRERKALAMPAGPRRDAAMREVNALRRARELVVEGR